MPGVERLGDPATCGHTNTGSTNVFANGKGVTRVDKIFRNEKKILQECG